MPSTAGELGNVQQDTNGVAYIAARPTQGYNSLQVFSEARLPEQGLVLHAHFRNPSFNKKTNLLQLLHGTTDALKVEIHPVLTNTALLYTIIRTGSRAITCTVLVWQSSLQSWTSLSASCALIYLGMLVTMNTEHWPKQVSAVRLRANISKHPWNRTQLYKNLYQ
jgi:hypothetical protein